MVDLFISLFKKLLEEFKIKNNIVEDELIIPTPTPTPTNKIVTDMSEINKYKEIFKFNLPNKVIDELPLVIEKFKINNNMRLAHFLGQCSHESGGFTQTTENLNYSADGLAKTWPNRYAIKDANGKVIKPITPNNLALTLHKKPELIANHTYANRMGNGDVNTGDGWKYRGVGYLQTTGKYNISLLSKYVEEDLVKHPELIAIKYPLLSAAFFFETNKLWSICDKGVTEPVITELTIKINGGTIGLKHRVSETLKFNSLLTK